MQLAIIILGVWSCATICYLANLIDKLEERITTLENEVDELNKDHNDF